MFDFYFSLCKLMFHIKINISYQGWELKDWNLNVQSKRKRKRIVYIFIHNNFLVHRTG